jgi:hypothetical protein
MESATICESNSCQPFISGMESSKATDFIRAGDDFRKIALLLILPFHYGFDYTWMIASEVDEDAFDASLCLVSFN